MGSWAFETIVPGGGLPISHASGSSTVTSIPSLSSRIRQPPLIVCQVPVPSQTHGGSAPA